MKLIRTGSTRIVVLTKNYAIKFPRLHWSWNNFITGLYCNMSEAQQWKDLHSDIIAFELEKYFCPVLFSFAGLILIMPKAKVCTKESQLEKIHHQPGEDIKPDNYGYLGEKLVCIDYAYHRIHPFKNKSSEPIEFHFADGTKVEI